MQERLRGLIDLFASLGVFSVAWWSDAIEHVTGIAKIITVFCAMIVGLHSVWRIVRGKK